MDITSISNEIAKLDAAEAAGEFVPITTRTYEEEVPDAIRGSVRQKVLESLDWASQRKYIGDIKSVERKIVGADRVYKVIFVTGEKAKSIVQGETEEEAAVSFKFTPETNRFEMLK